MIYLHTYSYLGTQYTAPTLVVDTVQLNLVFIKLGEEKKFYIRILYKQDKLIGR